MLAFQTWSMTLKGCSNKSLEVSSLNQVQQTFDFNISDLAAQVSNQMTSIINSTFTGIGNIIGSVSKTVMAIVTVPFILFYLLKDGKKLPGYVLNFLPILMRHHVHYGIKGNEQAN